MSSSGFAAPAVFDFDGDGKTDPTVRRSTNQGNYSTLTWYVLGSQIGFSATNWGINTSLSADIPQAGDYDGDGKWDIAVWRYDVSSSTAQPAYWYILRSSNNTFQSQQWDLTFDTPMPQDYDGDGKADVAVYRNLYAENAVYWWILQSSDGRVRGDRYGIGGDEPVRGDFDGDGKADLAVAKPSTFTGDGTFTFYILQTTNGALKSATLGSRSSDVFIPPSDFDGDGKDDIALFSGRSAEFSNGYWKYIRSRDNQVVFYKFGFPTDGAVPGDYDGDGTTDMAVYRRDPLGRCDVPSYFYVNGSRVGFQSIQFGSCHGAVSY